MRLGEESGKNTGSSVKMGDGKMNGCPILVLQLCSKTSKSQINPEILQKGGFHMNIAVDDVLLLFQHSVKCSI